MKVKIQLSDDGTRWGIFSKVWYSPCWRYHDYYPTNRGEEALRHAKRLLGPETTHVTKDTVWKP